MIRTINRRTFKPEMALVVAGTHERDDRREVTVRKVDSDMMQIWAADYSHHAGIYVRKADARALAQALLELAG